MLLSNGLIEKSLSSVLSSLMKYLIVGNKYGILAIAREFFSVNFTKSQHGMTAVELFNNVSPTIYLLNIFIFSFIKHEVLR